MILYLDTSALVKAYISEMHSPEVMLALKKAEITASHTIAYVEAFASFARLARENKLNTKQFESVKKEFSKDWKHYMHVENTSRLLEQAAEFSEVFALRAYDSMHLAAATLLLRESQKPVCFACYDQHLNKAAKVLGMNLL